MAAIDEADEEEIELVSDDSDAKKSDQGGE